MHQYPTVRHPRSPGSPTGHIRHSDVLYRVADVGELARNERPDTFELEPEVVLPAVPPCLARFQAPNEGMVGMSEIVGASVMVFRLVTTSDRPTVRANAEVYPS